MQKPILTVILFTYNHKPFIARCINSLLEQKTSYLYKINIWDDCSTDGTSDICREYADKYPDKIKLVVQLKNTFLEKDYRKIQSYSAMKEVDSKYVCAIDGDDYWTNENKIQMAVDFLENHNEYIGWAHDTLVDNKFSGRKISHVHDAEKWNCAQNKIEFSEDAPFFLMSSRIFRNCNYIQENDCLPIDYLFYYYHLSKGPIYYHDEIMAVYNQNYHSTFASCPQLRDLTCMFPYKVMLLLNFSCDRFCTWRLYKHSLSYPHLEGRRYKRLLLLKKIFGINFGWHLWFFVTFVPKYGLKCMSKNYVYDMSKAQKRADTFSSANKLKLEKKNIMRRIALFEFFCYFLDRIGLKKLKKRILGRELRKVKKIDSYLDSISSHT